MIDYEFKKIILNYNYILTNLLYFYFKMYEFLLRISLVFLWCVLSEVLSYEEIDTLPITDSQLSELADNVCSSYFNPIEQERCVRSLLNRKGDTVLPPSEIEIRCRSKFPVTFTITPSQFMQLVVVEPADETSSIDYTVIYPYQSFSTVDSLTYNTSLWSTILTPNGTSGWCRGPIVPKYEEPKGNRPYIVDMVLPYNYIKGDKTLGAIFKWNSSDEMDSCFEIMNYCEKRISGDFFTANLSPANNFSVEVPNIIKDDACTFSIAGKYGTTLYNYTTPCDETVDCLKRPEVPRNITVQTERSPEEGWDLLVRWNKPLFDPSSYNVTLFLDQEVTKTISGNATEVLFPGVTYEGVYGVLVSAIEGDRVSRSSQRNYLPAAPIIDPSMGIAISSVWTATILCAAVLGTFVVWRCRKERHTDDISSLKFPKEPLPEDTFLSPSEDDSWEIVPERVSLHEVIGEGAFGVVRRGMLAGACVAVKMLKDMPSREEIRSFRAEMELMKSVGSHPHVVSLVGCCTGRKPFIVAEYCGQGDLLTYLRRFWDSMVTKRNMKYYNNNILNNSISNYRNDLFKIKQKSIEKEEETAQFVVNKMYDMENICETELTVLDLYSFCRQIAMGMEFLEANRVVHRDLAARNILVTNDRTLKIADFGLSRDVYEDNQYKQAGSGKMPVKWMAPESLSRRIYTTKSDVWSFGVVVWEIWSLGRSPYGMVPAHKLPALLTAGHRLPKPPAADDDTYAVMSCCWRASPAARPSFCELHQRLDELLQTASSHHYLALSASNKQRPMPITRLVMTGAYERPRTAAVTNHYTAAPPCGRPSLFAARVCDTANG